MLAGLSPRAEASPSEPATPVGPVQPVKAVVTALTKAAPTILRPVVKISFDPVRCTNERIYPWTKKAGQNSLLQLEVLGDRTNLEDVARLLFKYYLGEVLQQTLDDHSWRWFFPYPLLSSDY